MNVGLRAVAVNVGALLTGVMVMFRVPMLLRLLLAPPSLTWKLTVRVAPLGLLLLLK